MHLIISWVKLPCKIKSLWPFIQESLMQPKEDTPPLSVSCYPLLKPAKNIRISCLVILLRSLRIKESDRVLRWLLLLEEYKVTFEYLPGKKNVLADALSCLDIDELTIPKEEALAILSESENSIINFPMYTALIFKEQIQVPGLREKGLSQPYLLLYATH
jgi:hypothetical protein